jgi:hypothetical protein
LVQFEGKAGDFKMEGNSGKVNPEVVNQALEKLARAFALAVKDVEFRKFIKAEVGKKFDGDYEFLYKFAREKRFIDGESFETKLGKGYSKVFKQGLNEGISRVKELVELIPKFNIAVPVNFEKWDAENYVPLVAYHPVGVDDKLVRRVKAFDSEGNEYWLDAWKAPDFPVIVLGVNERVDDNGNVRYFSLPNMRESIDDGGGGVGGGGGGSNDQQPRQNGCLEILEAVNVLYDAEPWTKGDAEIRLKIQGEANPGMDLTCQYFDGYNDGSGWRYPNRNLMNWWTNNYGNYLIYFWYEEDVGGVNLPVEITVNLKVFTFRIGGTWYDEDDQLGWSVVNFSDPYRNNYPYQTGNIDWYDKWINPPIP